MESEATRRRAWIEGQLQPQPDGTFLARPSAWIGGVFALPDAATKDRYVAYCERGNRMAVVVVWVFVAVALIGYVAPFAFWTADELSGFSAIWACLFVGAFLMARVLRALRHHAWLRRAGSLQVSPQRWTGTASRSIWSYYTDNELREIAKFDLMTLPFFVAAAVLSVFSGMQFSDQLSIIMLFLFLFCLVPIVGSLREVYRRRSAHRRGRPS